MEFYIAIVHERRKIRLKVEKLEETASLDKYRVTARNTTLVLQSNRPLLISKGLKHKKANWKILEGGNLLKSSIRESIIKEIEAQKS